MQYLSRLAVLANLGVLPLVLADSVVTFPYIGYGDVYDWAGYVGTPVATGADQTTYDVTCPTDKPCILVDWPELTITMVLGPSTFDFECSTLGFYTHSACTFTGSPTPTTATCSVTGTGQVLGFGGGATVTFTAPDSGINIKDIYAGTLTIAGGEASATPTGSATATTGTTVTSGTGGGSGGGTGTGTGTGAATVTVTGGTASSNGGLITAAPMMMAIGAVAGAVMAM